MGPQQSIGHYRVVSKLGEGGMGVVWRAIDTKLNRDVAIKVLPDSLAGDPDRLSRFQREAQVLASLNHPNIAAIYGIEQGAIVMEMVEGANLAGPLPVATAIHYAKQIAAGLEAAHEKGIVHRDLKPGNIKVTAEGTIKLLDFGLARAGAPTDSSATLTMTQAGMIVGTAAYMSPEQARGKPVDKRTDIWAFGVVLFEMLTGRSLFSAGETLTDILAAVVTREPDWTALPKDTPPHLRRLMERCLRKNSKSRLRDIGEARIALEEPEADRVAAPPRRPWLTWAACAVALASLGAAGIAWMRPHTVDRGFGTMRFRIPLPPGTTMPYARASTQWAPSPDGRYLAMVAAVQGKNGLWLRPLGSSDAHLLDNTEGAITPFWSPDGRSIGFFTRDQIKRVDIGGGAVFTVCDLPTGQHGAGAAWSKDGFIVFASDSGPLMRVPAIGGIPSALTSLSKGEQSHEWPQLLPDGRHVLYLSKALAGAAGNAVYVQDLASGTRVRVLQSFTRAVWSPPGYLLFTKGEKLYAQPMDSRSYQLQSEPVALAEAVVTNELLGNSSVAASENGVLVYLASGGGNLQAAWHDRSGKVLGAAGKPGPYGSLALSPDDKTLAVLSGNTAGRADLWTIDLASGATTAMTREGNLEQTDLPVWSPDSRRVAVSPRGGGIELITVASGKAEPLSKEAWYVQAWSPDGRSILCTDIGSHRAMLVPLAEPAAPQSIRTTSYLEYSFHFSPDGTYVAYVSNETGTAEVYVASFPSFADKRRVSLGVGAFPVWGANGKLLFYRSGGDLIEAEVRTAQHIEIGERRPLFKAGSVGHDRFAVTANGQRFLTMDSIDQEEVSGPDLVLIVDWPAELRRP